MDHDLSICSKRGFKSGWKCSGFVKGASLVGFVLASYILSEPLRGYGRLLWRGIKRLLNKSTPLLGVLLG